MRLYLCAVLMAVCSVVYSQTNIPLYTGAVPYQKAGVVIKQKIDTLKDGRLHISGIEMPSIVAYLPEPGKASGKGVILCPGGGYGYVSVSAEGHAVAKKLVEAGHAAFVLQYRLPNPAHQTEPEWVPLQDGLAALALIRSRANQFRVDPNKVGVLGFSAGGHLAASIATLFDKHPKAAQQVGPAFTGLIYPVISYGQARHAGTFKNLLGGISDSAKRADRGAFFSLDRQVRAGLAPAFLVHSQDDRTVPVENSILFYQACTKSGVPAEMHFYAKGGHGYGLGRVNNPAAPDWFPLFLEWLKGI